ncbi:hypothetical protein, partial [Haloferax profundi]|uniref:hypothetical protein n=1 Tax=Haloferax profundi TaxID=1544718 RepID=UPI001E38A53E
MSSRDDQPIHPGFEQYVPDEIVSLRQLEVLYGALWESRSAEDNTLAEPYAIFQTPTELTDFVASDETDDSRLLVLLHVDVTGVAPELTDVSVRPLTAELVP